MAVETYVVVSDIQSRGGRSSDLRTWNGGAAGTGINDIDFKNAMYCLVSAESAAEAIRGFKQLYGGSYSGKCFAILKSSGTEE